MPPVRARVGQVAGSSWRIFFGAGRSRAARTFFVASVGWLVWVKVPAGLVKTPTCRSCRSSRTVAQVLPVLVSMMRTPAAAPASRAARGRGYGARGGGRRGAARGGASGLASRVPAARMPSRPDSWARPVPAAVPPQGRGSDAGTGCCDRAQLSDEELALLRLIAEGLPMNSVAARLGMSPRTARRRMHDLCARIGATGTMQAVVWDAHRGLV